MYLHTCTCTCVFYMYLCLCFNLALMTVYMYVQERSKALGYIDSNLRGTEQVLEALDEEVAKRPPDNINQLRIKLSRCTGVQARRENVQPSPFCVYKFFDYPDHATSTVTGSNNPEYSDHKSYPVPMTADLDKYLKSQVGHMACLTSHVCHVIFKI